MDSNFTITLNAPPPPPSRNGRAANEAPGDTRTAALKRSLEGLPVGARIDVPYADKKERDRAATILSETRKATGFTLTARTYPDVQTISIWRLA